MGPGNTQNYDGKRRRYLESCRVVAQAPYEFASMERSAASAQQTYYGRTPTLRRPDSVASSDIARSLREDVPSEHTFGDVVDDHSTDDSYPVGKRRPQLDTGETDGDARQRRQCVEDRERD